MGTSSIIKNRERIGLPQTEVRYYVKDPLRPKLHGWLTAAEYQEIKKLREKNGSEPLIVVARWSPT